MNSMNCGAPVTVASETSYEGRRMASFARMLTGAASGLALMAVMGGVAQAQTAPAAAAAAEEEPEVIVVTGIRASLRNAANIKRNLDVISEVVTAEDVGKLPDTSIAEAIARLPGLTAQRVDGRAARISVRGLGPDFTTTLLNGREQVSTNDGRGVEFDQYPSELLSGVNIYKTTTATLAAQGIAGTADLRTVRPLSYGRRAAVVSGRFTTSSLGEIDPGVSSDGYRLTGSYIDQFGDNFGIALGVTHTYSPNVGTRTEAYNTGTTNAPVVNAAGVEVGRLGANVISPGGWKVMANSTAFERTGYMGVVQWNPTEQLSFVVDGYHSTFAQEIYNRGLEAQPSNRGGWLQGTTRVTDGYVTEGTFRGLSLLRNNLLTNDAEITAVGFNAKYDLTETTRLNFDYGYSAAERQSANFENQICVSTLCNDSTLTTYRQNSDGSLTLGVNANLNDPASTRIADPYGWGWGDIRSFPKFANVEDEMQTIRFDVEHDLEPGMGVSSVTFGIVHADRSKDRTFRETLGFLTDVNNATLPASSIQGSVDLGFGGLGRAIAFDIREVFNSGRMGQRIVNEWWAVLKGDWSVEEQVTTLYFSADIDTTFADIPVTGNFGLQYQHTEQASTALKGSGAGPDSNRAVRVTDGTSFGEVLPSLNLSFEPSEDFYVRLAMGRVLSRPNMQDLTNSTEVDYNAQNERSTDPFQSPWSQRGGGNPYLRPTVSRNFDISLERYYRQGAYWSLAYFVKNLETYPKVGGDLVLVDFSGFTAPPGQNPVLREGYFRTAGNAEGGKIEGIEFAFNLPFELLNESLDGFGMTFNVAQNSSSVEFQSPRNEIGSRNVPLPGLSETTGNLAFYYENYGFQARISARYRSEALQEIINYRAEIEQRFNEAETIVDAQIGYEFQEGSPFQGLSVQLQAANLLEEPWSTYYDQPYRALNSDEYGATYALNVTYKF